MKAITCIFLFLLSTGFLAAQPKVENIIIITTDGLRWQEVFKGLDTALANHSKFNQGDSLYIYKNYGGKDSLESREKLMPFFWSEVNRKGQLFGNRAFGNEVNNRNPHWFSYPGYSELFTGFGDSSINSNDFPPNPHLTVLEFIHRQKGFHNKVAAFGAWNAFDRILNEKRAGFPVISAYDTLTGLRGDRVQLLNTMLKNSHRQWHHECLDVFTHYLAMEYLKNKKPRVLFIGYGETDEWAHAGKYRYYLDAARQVDSWIREIWEFVQTDPQYRNKTAILITTDHGRGDQNKEQWTDHGSNVVGANEIWLAAMGPGIAPFGEIKKPARIYQDQFAQTIARLLGMEFKATHPIGKPIDLR